jgi:hypothetical protein
VTPDPGSDIILGHLKFRCEDEGDTSITISAGPDDTLDLVVGIPGGHVFDHEISPNVITLHQTRCVADTDCDDNNLCTADSCNPSTGVCSFNAVIDCDDNNLCTTELCDPSTGECVFDPVDCNDWNACTVDNCDPSTGECVYNSTDCNFGYFTDLLEPGNPGGWTSSLKTFDDEWTLSPGEEIEVDIWLNDIPETMLLSGFWLEYDSSLVSIIEVKAYDSNLLPGPWGSGLTAIVPEPDGLGTYFLILGQGGCVYPDVGGDIIQGRIRLRCESLGDVNIIIQPIPSLSIDTVMGCNYHIYDSQIPPHSITLHQVSNPSDQAIPTLSEWGIIIFMTLILGIGVVTLLRTRNTAV